MEFQLMNAEIYTGFTDEKDVEEILARLNPTNFKNRIRVDNAIVSGWEVKRIFIEIRTMEELKELYQDATINPLGDWTGGTDVDTGATNRKLGSDMADGVTGGGLHGKDLSKADVSVNIYAFLKAQETNEVVKISCAIGDKEVDGRPYEEIVNIAKDYIESIGGFEKFAEWGLF